MISKKTKYALHALISLSNRYKRGLHNPTLISELANENRIPQKFLEAILLELRNKGILLSKKGKGGGYSLAKSPSQITLGSIIRIMEGPLAPIPCVSQTAYRRCDDCADEHTCGIRMVMKEVRDATAQILDNVTFEHVLDKSETAKVHEMYFI